MQKFYSILPSLLLLLLQTCIAFHDELASINGEHPFTSRLYTIGKRNLQAIQIASNPSNDRQCLQPMVKFVANSRGTNSKSSELLIDFAKHLLSGYAQRDLKIIDLVDNYDIHIVPSLNPEAENDINRDFEAWNYKQMGNDETLQDIKPNTQDLLQWILEKHFQLSVNVDDSTADNRAMKDFHHYFTAGEEVQVHMSEPNSDDRQSIFNANKDQLLNQFDLIRTGIKGHILNRNAEFATGARLTFENDEKPVYTTDNCGEFWRSMMPGEYKVTAWGADNYRSEPMKVKIESGKMLRIDFMLDQNATGQYDHSKVFPNPELLHTPVKRAVECACNRATPPVETTTEAPPIVYISGPNQLSISHIMKAGDKPIIIKSVNYPMNYENGPYKCTIKICHADPNGRLRIHFPQNSFQLQNSRSCRADFLRIKSIDHNNKAVVKTLCGLQPDMDVTYTSATNCFYIIFNVNDDWITKMGFKAYISVC